MTKLAKYLKPFAAGLVLTIVLLFAQAICELNLPNYMSRIVNVGIQQNGIEHAAPDAISQNGMALMTTFMTEPEKSAVLLSYSLMSRSASFEDSAKILKKYPKAENSFYVKNSLNAAETDALDNAFGMAALTFVNIMEDMMAQSGMNEIPSESAMDITRVYELGPALASSGPEALSAAREKAMLSSPAAAKQSGIMLAKAFYEELGADIGAMQTAYIVNIGLIMLLISLLGGAATVFVSLFSTRIATGVARNLRKDVFEKVESFSSNEFDKFSTASLITRCTNDITQIQMLLMMGIRMICYAPIMGIGGIIMAVGKSPSMSWIIAVAVAVLVGMVMIVMSIAVPKFKIIQKLVDKLNLVAREGLSGLMVIRAFGTQNHEKQRFDKANKDLTQTNLFVNRIMVCMMPAMMLIMNGISLVIVWAGAHSIAASALQVGDMMAFIQYAMQIIMSFLMISIMFIMVPRAAVSAQRVAEVLTTDVSIKDPINPQKFNEKLRGVVEFKNVHFRYNGAQNEALSNISFTAFPGQTTAIIGSTGSGKSTIANLMLRFYDVSEGEIHIDGTDIRQVRQKDLREKIGYVPQKGVLLSGTIAFNLKYGKKDATDGEMETAASVAQAMEFIAEKPERFETEIAQGGANVSGGQKQRLSIARALAKDPEIIIFDDSFSALDFKTDAALRNALWKHTSKSTVIVVAQRVSTIMNADQIIVLEKGNIVGRGTHRELLTSCAEYREIAVSQLSEEELA